VRVPPRVGGRGLLGQDSLAFVRGRVPDARDRSRQRVWCLGTALGSSGVSACRRRPAPPLPPARSSEPRPPCPPPPPRAGSPALPAPPPSAPSWEPRPPCPTPPPPAPSWEPRPPRPAPPSRPAESAVSAPRPAPGGSRVAGALTARMTRIGRVDCGCHVFCSCPQCQLQNRFPSGVYIPCHPSEPPVPTTGGLQSLSRLWFLGPII
jgi:hypothetical protein